jgi:hypothetical protein
VLPRRPLASLIVAALLPALFGIVLSVTGAAASGRMAA